MTGLPSTGRSKSTNREQPRNPPAPDDAPDALTGLLAGLRLGLAVVGGRAVNARGVRELEGDARQESARLARVTDWDALAELGAWHQVSGLLLRGLLSVPLPPAAEGAIAHLRQKRDRAVRLSLRQLAALGRANCLAQHDVPYLVLKGLPLAQRLYGDAFARDALDIDLLVPPEAAATARSALIEAGFGLRLGFLETPARRRWHGRVEKAETFRGHGVTIELHQRLLANPHFIDARFERLFRDRSSVRIGTATYPTLGPDDDLLYLICHGAGHGWRRLKWLCDVALCLRGMEAEGRNAMSARAAEAGIDAVWGSTLLACRCAFELPLPTAEVPGGRRATMVAATLPALWRTGRWPPLWRKVPQRFALKPSLRFGLHELARLMLETDDWRRVNLPDRLFYLYFLLRPLLWAKDALRPRRKSA